MILIVNGITFDFLIQIFEAEFVKLGFFIKKDETLLLRIILAEDEGVAVLGLSLEVNEAKFPCILV